MGRNDTGFWGELTYMTTGRPHVKSKEIFVVRHTY